MNRVISAGAALAAVAALTVAAPVAASASTTQSAAKAAAKPPVTRRITVAPIPASVSVVPQLNEALVVSDNSVSVVGLRSHRQLAQFQTGFDQQLALAPVRGGSRAYLLTYNLDYLTIINPQTRKVTGQVPLGTTNALAIATSRAGGVQRAFVAEPTKNRLAVIRTRDNSLRRFIPLPHAPISLATSPNGRALWVGSAYTGTVWVINPATGRRVRTITAPFSGPINAIAFAPGGRTAWAAGDDGISVIQTSTGRVLKFLPNAAVFPRTRTINVEDIAFNASGTRALVLNSASATANGSVRMVNTRTYRPGFNIPLGRQPTSLAVDQQRNTAYVTNFPSDTLTYFSIPK